MSAIITCSAHGCTHTTTAPFAEGWYAIEAPERSGNGTVRVRYNCPECMATVHGYSTENDVWRGLGTDGFTYSTEWECMNPTEKCKSQLMRYGWMQSYDCTVDLEMKSPIYDGMKWWGRFSKTLEKLVNDGECEVDSHCGTHFHVGHKQFITPDSMELLRRYHWELFHPVSDYFQYNPHRAAALFGRPLGGWAAPISRYPWTHENFINLQHDYTVEFRACKWVSAKQYERAYQFCKHVVSGINNQFLKNVLSGKLHTDSQMREKAATIGNGHIMRQAVKFTDMALGL